MVIDYRTLGNPLKGLHFLVFVMRINKQNVGDFDFVGRDDYR